ncbi:MAG: hypothetical protein AAF149_10895 [Bacteroidota bacterium]
MRTILLLLSFSTALLVSQSSISQTVPKPPAEDNEMPYYDRHKIDISNIRDFYDGLLMADAINHADGMFDAKTKWKMTLYQMIRLGSNHYTARSAYQLSLMGVPMEEILAVWSPNYIESIKDPRIQAAYEYLRAISSWPSEVNADTHALLRTHFVDRQIAELIQMAGTNAPIARHDQMLPIPTDKTLLAWAKKNLKKVGWKPGLNASSSLEEQRANAFTGKALEEAYNEIASEWRPTDLYAVSPEFKTDWIEHLTGYGISPVTFDGDQDGIEEPFDFYPNDYLRWENPKWDEANLPDSKTKPFNATAYDYKYYKAPVVPKTKYPYSDRHKFDTEWTRMASMGTSKMEDHFSIKDRALPMSEKWPMFFVFQLASGCGHCQVHGSYGIYNDIKDDYDNDEIPTADYPGVLKKIHALFDFERSDLFTDAQKAMYRFGRDAASWPARTTAAHIEELRRYYSDREIQEIIETIIAASWLASDMQSQLTVTDRLSMSWALDNLTSTGWKPGQHLGMISEQRRFHMTEMSTFALGEINSGEIFDGTSEWIGVDVPLTEDSDSDGVLDGYDGFPNDPSRWEDTDRDGIEDAKDDDIDGDGIPNKEEIAKGTFPYKADSDGDGVDDPTEIKNGTDPVDPINF